MVGLLYTYNGKPQPKWPYGTTLNSATSWLSTITKSLLLIPTAECISQALWISYSAKAQNLGKIPIFDAASRGPWGSLELLWALRGSQIACFGALITILALGIDPTIQQSIAVKTRMRDSTMIATIPRAQNFLTYEYLDYVWLPTRAMIGAMYAGLLGENDTTGIGNSLDISPLCPTSNCTYPVFPSLAVHTHCDDISQRINTTCSYREIRTCGHGNITVCRYTLPSGLFISQALPATYEEGNDWYTRSVIASKPVTYDTIDDIETFFGMEVLRGNTRKNEMSSEAFRCELSWRINHYKSTVMNGRLSENILESTQANNSSWRGGAGNLFLRLPDVRNTSIFTVYNSSERGLREWLRQSLSFTNTYDLIPYNQSIEGERFPNVTGWGWERYNPDASHYSHSSSPMSVYSSMLSTDSMRVFLAERPGDIMDRLAKAMTTHIRSRGEADQTFSPEDGTRAEDTSMAGPVKGTAYILEIYIAVRWWWLSPLGAILVSTLGFFGLTVMKSRRNQVAVWKSSPLALLYHGLSVDSVKELRNVSEVRAMGRKADRIAVQLRRQGIGLYLEEVEKP